MLKSKFIRLLFLLYTTSFLGQNTYSDTFLTVSYSNNNGNTNFSTNWTESNDDNSPAYGRIKITGNELRFTRIIGHNIRRTANLSSAITAVLTFNWRASSLESGETLAIQASSDGVLFTTLTTITGTSTGTFNQDISPYISSNTTIRFINGGGNWNSTND